MQMPASLPCELLFMSQGAANGLGSAGRVRGDFRDREPTPRPICPSPGASPRVKSPAPPGRGSSGKPRIVQRDKCLLPASPPGSPRPLPGGRGRRSQDQQKEDQRLAGEGRASRGSRVGGGRSRCRGGGLGTPGRPRAAEDGCAPCQAGIGVGRSASLRGEPATRPHRRRQSFPEEPQAVLPPRHRHGGTPRGELLPRAAGTPSLARPRASIAPNSNSQLGRRRGPAHARLPRLLLLLLLPLPPPPTREKARAGARRPNPRPGALTSSSGSPPPPMPTPAAAVRPRPRAG
ncbi:translation initiation factor IF-2-like [Nycticebus coucang]|uniref:translation initiation factor IF-2-like n=1 Tax=Nycticebus coucang TaxID=9470 RepID=UPI00234CF31F|nr:translation initiation factor IF-2-like [Nycticebus coucang]